MSQFSTQLLKSFGLLITCLLLSLNSLAQSTEICNNGIDDDGDNLIDCQDPDCPECAHFISCVQPNTCYMPPTWGVPSGSSDQVFGAQDLVLSTNAPFTTVTIRTADNSYTTTVAVTSTGSTIVSLPLSVVMTNSSGAKQRNKGLIITSGELIQVTYRQTPGLNQDIVPLKCQAALGYAFYAGSQTRLGVDNVPNERHFVSVMATVDNTVVTFRSPVLLDGASTFPFSVTLNANETYLLSSRLVSSGTKSENKSVSGVLVTSNQPIVVNSGSQHTQQPYSGNRDAGIDQLVPARIVGQDYVAIHGQNTTGNADYIFVIAVENNTTVSISGPATTGATSSVLSTTTLNAGQVFTYNLPNVPNRAFPITTSKRAYVYHVSSYAVNEFGMGILPTINPCNGSKRIDFYKTSSRSNDQAIVTIPSSGTASLTFRGQPFSTYGTVIDRVTIGGIPQTIISFPNASIAAADVVNTLTSAQRFHVGVVSNTGGGSTGNYGYYSNYEAKVDVLNPDTGLPDDFYTVAQVQTGVANKHCLQLSSCGNTDRITSIVSGSLTQSATFDASNCITYTMKTSAPKCGRDTIRVVVVNELGKTGVVCLEYVNNDNDLILTLLSSSLTVCQPTGTVSLTAVPTSSATTFKYQWITPDKQVLTTQVITGTVPGRYFLSVTDGNNCRDTASVFIQPDIPAIGFTGGSSTLCAGSTGTYSITATSGTYDWSVTNGTIIAGGTPTSATATVQWGTAGTGTLRVTVTSNTPVHCTASVTRTVTINPRPSLAATTTSPGCNGAATGEIDLTVTGGTTPFTHRWSTGASTEDLANLVAGVYSVTVTDKNGCTPTSGPLSVTINQPLALSVATATTNITCNGLATGVISLTVSGGTTPYSYSWSNGASGSSISNLTAGLYSVSVKDKNGCTGTGSFTLTQPPAITLVTSKQNVTCNGASTGSISLTAKGGTGVFSFRWNDGSSSQNRSGLLAGTYSVTATDANGCTALTTVVIQQPPALTTFITQQNPVCNGASTGSINLIASGGSTPYQYLWSNGAATASINSLTVGIYSVTVTDNNGCSATTSATLTQPPAISLTITQTDVLCAGKQTGSVSVTASGGVGPFNFRWETGSQQAGQYMGQRTGLAAGTYSLTVTDANNCSVTTTLTITQPPALTATLTTNNPTCNGASTGSISLNPSGGVGPYQYSWNTGATTQNLTGIGAGSYTVTITDQNSCIFTTQATLTQPPAVSLSVSMQNITCNGASTSSISLTAAGGTGTFTYQWSTGAATPNLTAIGAGTYSVTTTDANGCVAVTTATLTQPTALTLSQTHTDVSCNGGMDGRINLTAAGGTGGYTYLWSNNATQQDIQNLLTGTYSVTVTDANGCLATLTTFIAQPTALSLITTVQNPACSGAANGSVSVSPAGGTAPYSYVWADGSRIQNRTDLVAGVYSVTVTDANGCSIPASVTLTQPDPLSVVGQVTNVSCNGGSTGAISVSVTGGTAGMPDQPYSYVWSTGATTATLSDLTSGAYSLTVTDSNGCQTEFSAAVMQPRPIVLMADITNELCNGNQNGTITTDVRGGTTPYMYLWSNGSVNASVYQLPPGSYTLVVTDLNSCTASLTSTVTQPPVFGLNVVVKPVACNGTATGEIDLTVEGATPPYRYRWSTGATAEDLTGLTGGLYSLTVTDANDCVETTTINVQESTAILLTETHIHASCFGTATGAISVTATGGRSPFAYAWSDGTTTPNRTRLATGLYSLTVTDANQCTAMLSVSITQPTPLQLTPAQQNVACFGGSDGLASVSVVGGTQPYQYIWNTGETTASVSSLTTGTYSVTITDAQGCQAEERFVISQPAALTVSAIVVNNLCANDQKGSITLAVSGGTEPYGYAWQDGISITDRTALLAGGYSVTVTDANGCAQPLSVTLTEPSLLSIVSTTTPPTCAGLATGAASLITTGGTLPYRYTWNDGNQSDNRTGLVAGGYSVTVTDASGCTIQTSLTLVEPDSLRLQLSSQNILCAGGTDGAISLTLTGGTRPYQYRWTDGSTDASRTNLPADTYQLLVTDAQGCQTRTAQTLTQPDPIQLNNTATNVSCSGRSDGQISLTVTGGVLPYTFLWNTGETTSEISVLTAGVYSVTLSDANNCIRETSLTLTEPTALTGTIAQTSVSCYGQNDGEASISISGGTGPYAYLWSTNETTPVITNLVAGGYSVTVTDANGCSLMQSLTITEGAFIPIEGDAWPAGCSGANSLNNGRIVLTQFSAGLRFAITPGTSFTDIVTDISVLPFVAADGVLTQTLPNPAEPVGQAYTVRVLSEAGCYGDLTVILPQTTCVCQPICIRVVLKKTKSASR